MSTINAQSIIAEVMAAHAIAPREYTLGDFIKFQTSARGSHRIINCQENLQRFADLVRKNATAFGGGLMREEKTRSAVSYNTKTISLYKQLIEDRDYFAALQLADEKLSPLFFVDRTGKAHIQVAPIPLEADSRLVSVLNEHGTWSVIDPVSMLAMHGDAKNKRSRDAQIENAMQRYSKGTDDAKVNMFAKAYTKPADQAAARAQWLADHGIVDDAAIDARIEAQAAQDVAEIVAQAVAVSAIAEAMAPSESSAPEVVTCEAGESEDHAVTVGSVSGATWAPVPQYVPCPPDKTGFNDGPAPSFRGDDGDTPTPPPAEFLGESTPPVVEFLPIAPVYQLPEKQDDWSGAKYSADFVPNARQQIVIDAVQTALNEGKYYTSDVLARCIELLNIDAHTASMNFGEGGIVGMDCYYARGYIDAKKAREASLKTFNEMALREGDELGILVFTDYKRTTGVKITGISEGGSTFTFTGKRGAYTVTGTGSTDQLKCAIDRAFSTGKRKTDYAAFLATQAKRPTPTPPAMESQPEPVAPVVETESHAVPMIDAQSLIEAGFAPVVAECIERVGIDAYGPAAQAEILAKLESVKTQIDATPDDHAKFNIRAKSGAWFACVYMIGTVYGLRFDAADGHHGCTAYATHQERMQALEAMARATTPPDTPPDGGQPIATVDAPTEAPTPPVAECTPDTPVAVSSAEFERIKPFNLDPRKLLEHGVQAAQLIGLGVKYTGNMSTPDGIGAITDATDTRGEKFGSLKMTVTLEDGTIIQATPFMFAADLRPILQFDGKMHGAPYLSELAMAATLAKSQRTSAEELKKQAHVQALIELAAQYPQLKRADSTSYGGTFAAKNIRILLKEAFKGQKFSVTSDYNSVRVNWTDGPSDKQVNEVVGRFDIGASDSQSDYFYTVSTAFSQLFGGVQYLSTRREVSDSLIQVAIDRLYSDRSEKPTVTDYRKCTGVFDWNSQNYENRQMREMLETLGK